MRVLDLCCCQGGAARGYADVGFEVVGVDIAPQPRYPYEFHQADVLETLRLLASPDTPEWLWHIAAVHVSPPCQAYTNAWKLNGREHPDLIGPVRELLEATGVPYVIENVPGAPLLDPVELCGAMFPGLATYRHRLFETNWPLTAPAHPEHRFKTTKMGRPPRPGEFMHVVGNFSGVTRARAAMGIDWMSRDGLREAIPPAYTEFIGQQLLAHIKEKGIAA